MCCCSAQHTISTMTAAPMTHAQRVRLGCRDAVGRFAAYPPRAEPLIKVGLDDEQRQELLDRAIRLGLRDREVPQSPDQAIRSLLDDHRVTHDFSRACTPTAGFMVTLPGHRTEISLVGQTHRSLTQQIRLYVRQREDLLREPSTYVGGRIDSRTDVLILDVTRVEMDIHKARQLAQASEQPSFYDAQTQEEVPAQ